MLCIACGEATDTAPCAACGDEPRLDGRWSLLEVLGQGANGTTYKAVDPDGYVVAAKESTLKTSDPAKLRELVEREARVLRQLSHDGIPGYVEEIWHQQGRSRSLFLLQEHVEGVDLQRRLDDHRFDEDEVLDVLDELAGILGYLHTRQPPIVHRDVKPSNVMRRPDGRHVLLDFGSVRDVLKDARLGGSTVAGTFGFMAPEQFAGDASPKSDLYGLGALAVALLTRQDPAKLQRHDRTIDWHDHAAVSERTAAMLDQLLALDPAQRPGDAAAVAALIAAIRRGDPPEPGPNAPWARDKVTIRPPVVLADALVGEEPDERVSIPPPVVLADALAAEDPEDFHQPPAPHRPKASPEAPASTAAVVGITGVAAVLGMVLVSLSAGLFMLFVLAASSDAPPSIELPATPAAAAPRVLTGAPWPTLTQEELTQIPSGPTCVFTLKDHEILAAPDACPPPLQETAQDWFGQQILQSPEAYREAEYMVLFAQRPPDDLLLASSMDVIVDRDADPGQTYVGRDGELTVRNRVQPRYPDAAKQKGLAPVKCMIGVYVGADGVPDRLSIHDCPATFHGTTGTALAQWRWEPGEPAHTTVGVTYKFRRD